MKTLRLDAKDKKILKKFFGLDGDKSGRILSENELKEIANSMVNGSIEKILSEKCPEAIITLVRRHNLFYIHGFLRFNMFSIYGAYLDEDKAYIDMIKAQSRNDGYDTVYYPLQGTVDELNKRGFFPNKTARINGDTMIKEVDDLDKHLIYLHLRDTLRNSFEDDKP